MVRAIEKGATYLDKLCHKFYDEPKGRGNKTDYVCRLCGGPLETYYCEERLYLVKCADCGTLALVKTVNPEVSASVTLAQPTLTPPNAPLTLDELREMDGEPVWIVEHPDWGHWELSADAEDYIADRDQDLYGLKHDGKHKCSECGGMALEKHMREVLSNYCPNCGAKMDGGDGR